MVARNRGYGGKAMAWNNGERKRKVGRSTWYGFHQRDEATTVFYSRRRGTKGKGVCGGFGIEGGVVVIRGATLVKEEDKEVGVNGGSCRRWRWAERGKERVRPYS
ncbi:hypothetical protein HAX54_016250, partial [Datura stramonium]|nr:hypothetical protein [Datura stramonium]